MNQLFANFSHLFPVWNTTRAAGLTSYLLLFISIVTGISQSFKSIHPKKRKTLNIIHESTGWFGVLFGLVHGLVLMFDQDVTLSLGEILIPFTAKTDAFPIGIGTISLYIMLILILTSDFMKKIGAKLWRAIHFLSFPGYLLGLIHGIWLGPDTKMGLISFFYYSTAIIVCGLVIWKVVHPRNGPKKASVK
ncbi:ferric reductase-like transmembrane domain-containing protein [Bacillus sp. FJAT-49736]|uniref:ferric reductase-like transmembrane domain-containing protein n=1 Tax=Bacillus sp. FJAT-49736 TaxID=2833582 RepID=UPI001BC935A2|nr:ferric reductase-like transmembrane domain-containing protein [Bacillus sp. FJAT-49736]MBS4174016.1 ferric reductase-like transmembrane domain-containing protein [Bacillus sp. FJAT-49736]